MSLPVIAADDGLVVIDPDTAELTSVHNASDRALANAAQRIAELDKSVLSTKRTIAAELRERHGVGTVQAGGYGFLVVEGTAWPAGATQAALDRLVDDGHIGEADAKRCMPSKPKPDARALKALAGRLALSDADAHRILTAACTTSPASVRDVREVAVTVVQP